MIRYFLPLLCVLLCSSASSQDLNDATRAPLYKFSVSLQLGQPNKLYGAEVSTEDGRYNVLHGDLGRFSMGTGFSVRYYTDESFFLHFRLAYSMRRYELYDSIVNTHWDETQGNTVIHHSSINVTYNHYHMQNILIGIGGGHEKRYGEFCVRAGGEIDYIRYTELFTEDESRNYTIEDHDSLSGGTYHSEDIRGFSDYTEHPLIWGIGITGHASLEYMVKPDFGIGASLYLGGYFVSVKNLSWKQSIDYSQDFTDSNGVVSISQNPSTNEFKYSVQQFDFSPLNGQINFAWYFGK